LGNESGEHGAEALLENLAGDEPDVRVVVGDGAGVFAAAEADFEPDRGAAEIREVLEAQARQGDVEQTLLARPQGVGALTAVESVGWGFYTACLTRSLTPALSRREGGKQGRERRV
jgi:hypothetical protein